jgi:hypothetical protein
VTRWRPDRAGWALAAAGVFWLTAWLAAPPGVPLYDGIGFPDEPYRYVAAPPGAPHTAPPTTARGRARAGGGTNIDLDDITSAEQGPQIEVALEAGTLDANPNTVEFQLAAIPVAATAGGVEGGPTSQSPGGAEPRIDGNVYRVTATAFPAGPVGTRPDGVGYVVMRATTGRQPGPTFVYRAKPTTSWRPVRTERIGVDIYQTRLAGLGDYALGYFASPTVGGTVTQPAVTRRRSHMAAVLLIGGLLVSLTAAVLAVRLARTRQHPAVNPGVPPGPGPEPEPGPGTGTHPWPRT